MRRVSHLRNIIVAFAVIGVILLASHGSISVEREAPFANIAVAAPLQQATNFFWNPLTATVSVTQGGSVVVNTFTLRNDTGTDGVPFQISIPDKPASWTIDILPQNPVFIDDGVTRSVVFVISVPSNEQTRTENLTIRATRTDVAPGPNSDANLTVTVTPPATATSTPATPSATIGPTETPRPACENGVENSDPGNDRESAQLILVDVLEAHGICRIGDEDWFKFGAVAGKVYSIDVPRMDNGLDLAIDLYDPDGNYITSNDDFYDRPSSVPGSGPGDTRPRIDSWRAPFNGVFYFRVRDSAGIGGNDTTYDVIVEAESYGPTPTQVPEICQDLFEPDGLPENSRLITSNEIQRDHRLCPNGDADWIRFFGKTDKIYCIYTDTRPYNRDSRTDATPVNSPSEAGADTVLYLADRDGVSIIDFNDDIERNDDVTKCIDPSPPEERASLDSAIRFVPPADGFYYAQVKNTGDIGNQFIRYDLVLKLCLPNQECSRAASAAPVAPIAPTPRAGETPTATTQFVVATSTPTPTPTEEDENLFIESASRPGEMINGPTRGFADRSFAQVWARADQPIAQQRATRSWMWGPRGLMARGEGYMQASGGLRQVQYFDKARMEITDSAGDRNSRWFVTTGLLVIELITGRAQIGDNDFVQHTPAGVPIAGDTNDTQSPTYASFGGVTAVFPGDRTGKLPEESIDRAGRVSPYEGPTRPETRLAHFVPESGHNIPRVFWDFLNAGGTIYESGAYRQGQLLDWVFTLGYPISEPYWAHISVGGVERQVLVQPFQRRVLTYDPANPSGWRVEMGNVGRHYYRWRYGEELPPP